MSGRTRLVLVRHGRTSYNVQGRLQGRLDIDLDDQVALTAAVQHRHAGAALAQENLNRLQDFRTTGTDLTLKTVPQDRWDEARVLLGR